MTLATNDLVRAGLVKDPCGTVVQYDSELQSVPNFVRVVEDKPSVQVAVTFVIIRFEHLNLNQELL